MNFEELKVNLDMFCGFLSNDPEIRYFESGRCKTTFAIPLKKNKEDEAKWLNCECWGKTAEKVSENYKKGDEVIVLGYFKEEDYQDKTGATKTKITFKVKGVI